MPFALRKTLASAVVIMSCWPRDRYSHMIIGGKPRRAGRAREG
jgi:hypothetical protein